jgi:hypothetical protein
LPGGSELCDPLPFAVFFFLRLKMLRVFSETKKAVDRKIQFIIHCHNMQIEESNDASWSRGSVIYAVKISQFHWSHPLYSKFSFGSIFLRTLVKVSRRSIVELFFLLIGFHKFGGSWGKWNA